MSDRPDIVFLFPDQHRWDVLGGAASTPNLERLASEGVRFDRAYVQAPLCVPSRVCTLTGRYVHQHGVKGNGGEVSEASPTFLQSLQRAGYHTAAVGKCHVVNPSREARRPDEFWRRMRALGFSDPSRASGGKHESVRVPNAYQRFLASRGLLDTYVGFMERLRAGKHSHAEPTPLPTDAFIDWWTGDVALEFLRTYDLDDPLFLHVGFPGPHHPFDAPAEWVEPHRDVPPLGTLEPPDKPTPIHDALLRALGPVQAPEEHQKLTAAYYGNVSLIDHKVGEILQAIEARGRPTVVVYTSDHGESLGHHGLLEKLCFFEPSVRVPLIVKMHDGSLAGTRDDRPAQLIDVPATLLEAAGAEPVPESMARSLFGESRDAVFSEQSGYAMVATPEAKLVCYAGNAKPVECYDLRDDPLECRNLAGEPEGKAITDDLLERFMRPFLADVPDGYTPTEQPARIGRRQLAQGDA